MIRNICNMTLTLIPTIVGAIFNMIFCKSKILNILKKPIDNNIILRDNQRLFGDNKTYKGFIGYIFFNILVSVIWGYLLKIFNLTYLDFFYVNHNNTIVINIIIGLLLGFAYAIFELPNSFIKRRLKMKPGINYKEGYKKYFFIVDQIDSILGVLLVVRLFYKFSFIEYIIYVLVGAGIHILINLLLFKLKLRKNKY